MTDNLDQDSFGWRQVLPELTEFAFSIIFVAWVVWSIATSGLPGGDAVTSREKVLGFLRAHGWVFVIVTVLTLMLVVTDALRPKLPTWYTYEAAPDRSQEHWLAFDWRV